MKRIGRGRYLLLAAALACTDALACSCLPDDREGHMEKATLVFVGQPVKIEEKRPTPPPVSAWQQIRSTLAAVFGAPPKPIEPQFPGFLDSVRVTFEVSEYRKGRGPRHIQIMTGYGDSDCGLPVRLLKRYVVYAHRMEGELRTSYCFGSDEYVRPQPMPSCKGSNPEAVVQ